MKTQNTPKKSTTSNSRPKSTKNSKMTSVEHEDKSLLETGKEIVQNLLGSMKSHENVKPTEQKVDEHDKTLLDKGKDLIQGAVGVVSAESKSILDMGKDLLEKGRHLVGDIVHNVADFASNSTGESSDTTGFEHTKVLKKPAPKKAVIKKNAAYNKNKTQELRSPKRSLAPKSSNLKESSYEAVKEEPKVAEIKSTDLEAKKEDSNKNTQSFEAKKTNIKTTTPKNQDKKSEKDVTKTEEPKVKEVEKIPESKDVSNSKSEDKKILLHKLASPKASNAKSSNLSSKDTENRMSTANPSKKLSESKRPATAHPKTETQLVSSEESVQKSKDDFSIAKKDEEVVANDNQKNASAPKKSFLKAHHNAQKTTDLKASDVKESSSKTDLKQIPVSPKRETKSLTQRTPKAKDAEHKTIPSIDKKSLAPSHIESTETPKARSIESLPAEQKMPQYPTQQKEKELKQDLSKTKDSKVASRSKSSPKVNREKSSDNKVLNKSSNFKQPIRRSTSITKTKEGLDHTTEDNKSFNQESHVEPKTLMSKSFTSPKKSIKSKVSSNKTLLNDVKESSHNFETVPAKKEVIADKAQSSTVNENNKNNESEDKTTSIEKKNEHKLEQSQDKSDLPHFMRGTISSLKKKDIEPLN